jgi:hypothetical protein
VQFGNEQNETFVLRGSSAVSDFHRPSARIGCLSNKLLIYKVVIKPIWTYGIQLCGAASTSNNEILERFQSKALRLITDAHGMFQMPLFGVTYKSHPSKKKFVASAPSTTLDSAPIPTS